MSKKKIFIAVSVFLIWLLMLCLLYSMGKKSVNENLGTPQNGYDGYEIVINGKEIDESKFSADDLKDVKWYVEKKDKENKILYIITEKK